MSHKVTKAVIPGVVKHFYCKEMKSDFLAHLEVLAQEFFRLIIGSQPETRIAYNSSLGTYFVLSEEVPGYKNIPLNSQELFTQGRYFGLGPVMILSVFLQEIDLKNGNVGLNDKNQVVKIDGDWCFAAIRDSSYSHYKKKITLDLITKLPFLVNYSSFNWLDILKEGVAYQHSNYVDVPLANAPYFRNEINEAILKMLVLPDFYIHHFVDAYVPVVHDADAFIKYLKDRREELKAVALQEPSFKAYLQSDIAKEVLEQHLTHMKHFVVNGSSPLLKCDEQTRFDEEVMQLSDALFSFKSTDLPRSTSRNKDMSHINRVKSHPALNQEREQVLKYINFDKHIRLFIQKKKEMSLKALYNPNYSEAAKTASSFCEALMHAKKNFLSSENALEQAQKEFNGECMQAVHNARTILDHHREWNGVIRKFIMDVISFLTAGWTNNKLSLFAQTDSAKKLDDLEEALSGTINSVKVK